LSPKLEKHGHTSPASPHLKLLEDLIDISAVPFSDRGSRLLVFANSEKSQLYLKLAERLTSIQPGIESYLSRPPYIEDLRFVDGDGQALDYRLTTYPHALLFQTRLGTFWLAFRYSAGLAFGLPEGVPAGISFRVRTQMRREVERGGALLAVRNLSYYSNGRVLLNEMRGDGDGHTVKFILDGGQEIAIHLNISDASSPDPGPASALEILSAAEARWENWFARVPDVDERFHRHYYYAWWLMANSLISPLGQVKYESMMPAQSKYVGIWNWDSCFHVLAFRHLDVELARDQLRSILAAQLPNGMLPDVVYDEGVVAEIDHPIQGAVTKPPVVAWAALKVDEIAHDPGFLREIYEPLVRWNAWWFNMNDDDADGLAQYTHPYSSGLDDSPLWDYGMPVESPDLNTYLCIQMDALAKMAEILGKGTEAALWKRRSAALLQRMIADLWDEETGLFYAMHAVRRIPVVTPFNLYPLWTGQLPERMRERLVAHLSDPAQFWGEYALPSVARDDPHYAPEVMWRGPVWLNINYIFIEALRKVGKYELADELMQKTLSIVMEHMGMYEYYQAETGQPPASAAKGFGWTAAVFIDLAIQASRSGEGGVPR
jgi:hypothetical protein